MRVRLCCAALLLVLSITAFPVSARAIQDTVIVRADNPPKWGADLVLREEWRVGSLLGEVEESFGNVAAVAPAPDGTVLIADGLAPAIRRFSDDGEYLSTVGGAGEGPAEYREITGLEVLIDGTVILVDGRLARITRMSLEGIEESTTPMLGGFFSIHRTVQIGRDGTVYHNRMIPASGEDYGSGNLEYVWMVYPPGEGTPDTIQVPPEDPSGPRLTLRTADGDRTPFTVKTLNWMSPLGGLVWGRNDEYVLASDLGDKGIQRIRRNADEIPVTNPEWRQWTAILNARRRQGGVRQPRVPNQKPYFRDLWIDAEGRIWVERYVPAVRHEYTEEELARRSQDQPLYEWREPTVFDIIDSSGLYLGQLILPERTHLVYARGDLIWAVQIGEYDESYYGGHEIPYAAA
jgi:hypothetical protein